MASYLPPDVREGRWGAVTATLDWCEANYQFSYFIAEMANALSNLFSIGLALLGFYLVQAQSLPTRFSVGYLIFCIVGIGSLAFHTTLTIEAQLADELPMIYTASHAVFVLLDTKRGFEMDAGSWAKFSVVSAFAVLFTWSYCLVYRNPVYHQVVFASLVILNTLRAVYLLNHQGLKDRFSQASKSAINRSFLAGVLVFASGFFVWNLDNIFCWHLTSWKNTIGWPIAFLLEGHSWWHFLTGLGTYLMFVALQMTSLCIKDDYRKYAVDHVIGLPYIKRTTISKYS